MHRINFAVYNAGKSLSNENHQASIMGGVSGAKHIHTMENVTFVMKDGEIYKNEISKE